MVRNWSVLLRSQQSCSRWLTFFLLLIGTAILCIFSSPTLATLSHISLNVPQTKMQNSPALSQRLVEQGKIFYEAGLFTEALKVLEQAAVGFDNTGDQLNQAIALSNLALIYQQLGKQTQAEQAISQSLNLLQNLDSLKDRAAIMAQALDVQGKLQLAKGQTEVALSTWQKAAKIYLQIGDQETLTRNRINSAQAMQTLGLYRQAQKTLTEVQKTFTTLPDSLLKVAGLHSLANVLRVIGDLNASRTVLEQSLTLAKKIQSPTAIADSFLSLGNTAFAKGKTQQSVGNTDFARQEFQAALNFYQQAVINASATTRIQAQLNQLSLLLEIFHKKETADTLKQALLLCDQILSEINKLVPSRNSVYTRIQFASILIDLTQKTNTPIFSNLNIAQLLSTAIQQAQSLKDQQAQSYALGTLGRLYEKNKQLADALELTEKALFIAQTIDASDITYQWQWQQGRLFKQQGNIKAAIAAYNTAYKTLESLRGDLVGTNPDVQFSFRESVEPLYRELVELQLRAENIRGDQQTSQYNLKQARKVIESLQLAELNNFFHSPCLEPIVEIDKVVEQDKKAAVIYPVILPDRFEVILTLPNQQLHHYSTNIPQEKVESTVALLRKSLTDVSATYEVKEQSQKIYDWLIRPAETELSNSGITTLVFVLDGELRNIPMGVLYNPQQDKYLMEKYAIALTPGLQLFNPKPVQKIQLNALIAGVGEARSIEGRKFSPLKNVAQELKQIQAEIPKSQELLNQKFINSNLLHKLQTVPFSVVHLATHGEFSSDPEKTFLLTWDKLLKLKQFDTLLRVSDNKMSSNIELLVLSACKTALGDKRAALGLAGIAVRAGARSTIASLWSVDDQSTAQLMSEFYHELKTGINKAQALQLAQLAVFAKEKSPYFWAPYVLLGNWL
ncbi:CHAT domain-containing protein [aff. Roholtiella sp. LEGE 12411]|uniref:CHAT domain-containing protein n=1 Tax=aff. Roholtiella sp. LEGE 12411 TaxID=1828822 RepID=UPI00187FAACA|nr:CHAT domain-containing protein [aff. Roholtiella sp. LEGE 12411]MBE9035034.1 CHAT domain-containing protein [aff. Roholtiella sp. LEGE 12411]